MDLFNRDIPNLPELKTLQAQMEELLVLCTQLKQENQELREKQQILMEKNEQARIRVESIVTRLKELEDANS